MGHVVVDGDGAAVRFHNGLAQRKAQAQSSPAVAGEIVSGIEQIENMRLLIIRDSRAFIRNANQYVSVFFPRVDFNACSCRSILDGIVQKVDDHLYNQSGICVNEQKRFGFENIQAEAVQSSAHVPHSFGDHIIYEFCVHVQLQASIFHSAGR